MSLKGKTIDEFAHFISGDDAPIVVGGQAVHIWSQIALDSDTTAAHELQPFKPFTSKDCDVLGDRSLLERLAKKTKLRAHQYAFGQPTCCIGFLYDPNDQERQPVIEVLDRIRGLEPDDIAHPIELKLDGKTIRTLNPLHLLQAKLANAAEISQERRQDVRHVRMLIPCVRVYLTLLQNNVCEGKAELKTLKAALRHCLELIGTGHAQKVSMEHEINLKGCLPFELLRASPLEAVQNFCKHQLP